MVAIQIHFFQEVQVIGTSNSIPVDSLTEESSSFVVWSASGLKILEEIAVIHHLVRWWSGCCRGHLDRLRVVFRLKWILFVVEIVFRLVRL